MHPNPTLFPVFPYPSLSCIVSCTKENFTNILIQNKANKQTKYFTPPSFTPLQHLFIFLTSIGSCRVLCSLSFCPLIFTCKFSLCSVLLVCSKPLGLGIPSVLDPHWNSPWISIIALSHGDPAPTGPQDQPLHELPQVVHRRSRCWDLPDQSPGCGSGS